MVKKGEENFNFAGNLLDPMSTIVANADQNVYSKINFLSELSLASVLFSLSLFLYDRFDFSDIYLTSAVIILIFGSLVTTLMCLTTAIFQQKTKDTRNLF
jgi:ABC-type uncharacterized transport system permease subunit